MDMENLLKLKKEAESNNTLKNNIYLKQKINELASIVMDDIIKELKKKEPFTIVYRKVE